LRLSDGEPPEVMLINKYTGLNIQGQSPNANFATVKPTPAFDAQKDAENLKNAIGVFSNKNTVLIDCMANRTYQQRLQIQEAYTKAFGKDLKKELESKTSFNFKKTLSALLTHPAVFDAHCLKKAVKGLGTDEELLIEILCNRSNSELNQLKSAYQKEFGVELEKDIVDDTSGDFKKIFINILKAARDESTNVDDKRAETDAQALYDAGEKRWGTDEDKFIEIFTQRSYPHLARTYYLII